MRAVAIDSLVARQAELDVVAAHLDGVRAPGAILLLEGPAGIGKTTLWRAGLGLTAARTTVVLQAHPSEAERAYPYAALADLLRNVDDRVLAGLPEPQARALRVALLQLPADPGSAAQAFAVAAGFLGVVRTLSQQEPVVIAIDDVQWLDAPSIGVLRHAAQRVERDPLTFLLARRADDGDALPGWLARPPAADRVVRLAVRPLSMRDVEGLLFANLGRALPRAVIRRIHERAQGNPLLSLELARSVVAGDVAMWPPGALPASRALTSLVEADIRRLPAATREGLAVAALMSQPTLTDVRRLLPDRSSQALEAAFDGGVARLDGDRIVFTHPVRSAAVIAMLSPARRRLLHRRIAATRADVVERVQHRFLAATGPDAGLAMELEDAAHVAWSRGAPATAADLAELAARMTPQQDVPARQRRTVLEADAAATAGEPTRASERLERLVAELPAGAARAAVLWQLADVLGQGIEVGASADLYRRARSEAGPDAALRIRCDLRLAAWSDPDEGDLRKLAAAARRTGDQSLVAGVLVELAAAVTRRTGRVPKRIITAARGHEASIRDLVPIVRWPRFAEAELLAGTADIGGARARFAELADEAADRGDENSLGWILALLVPLECELGEMDGALSHADEAILMARAAGQTQRQAFALASRALVRAHQGDAESTVRDVAAARDLVRGQETPLAGPYASWALGVLELGRGRPSEACAQLVPLLDATRIDEPGDLGLHRYVFDAGEALVRGDRLDEANALLERCAGIAERGLDPESTAGVERIRGLVLARRGELDAAREHLAAAADTYQALGRPFLAGRTLIALGSCARRSGAKRDARRLLSTAVGVLEERGAAAWVADARAELRRIGGRTISPGVLTAGERRVADLVATGHSNRETAAILFIAERTVESHLSAIYAKLGVRSRSELAARLAPVQAGMRADESGDDSRLA
jgi:DNA-binding CsgD family transcriptional regulator